jgi:hypothetical protein
MLPYFLQIAKHSGVWWKSLEARGKCPVRVQQGGPPREVDSLRKSEQSTEYYQNFTTAITFSRAAGGNARSNEVHVALAIARHVSPAQLSRRS